MAYKRKGCGPQALGSPIKQQAKSISKKMSESDGVKITEDLIDERLESRKVRDSLKKNFRHDGSYDPKLFPPIKDDSGKIVTPGYDPKKEKGISFEGLLAQFETRKIFSQIKIESERASMALAETYGEPLWCSGTGYRNTHLRAVAPTVSNSKLSGNVSPGIEPWAANVFTEQTAKGTFIRKNPSLVKLLRKLKINTNETWEKILADGGSVQNITELDNVVLAHDTPAKEVFKTFKEINQLELVNQAGLRQQYVDQSVSLNLAFPSVATPKWINKVHFEAWKKGIKTLYYTRTESVLRGDIAQQAMNEDCLACDG